MKIVWSPLAVERVSEVALYLADDNPSAAERWVDSIFKETERLKKFPILGRVCPEVGKKEIREIIFGNYRIIYRVEEKEIIILTVRHGKQILRTDEL